VGSATLTIVEVGKPAATRHQALAKAQALPEVATR